MIGIATCLDFSQDGLAVAIGTDNGSISIWDLSTNSWKTPVRAPSSNINDMAIDVYHHEFATANDDCVSIWSSVSPYQLLLTFPSPLSRPLCVCYHPSSSEHRLAVGFTSGAICILDIATSRQHIEHLQHETPVVDLCFSPDARYLYSLAQDGSICMYDVRIDYQPCRMFTIHRARQVDRSQLHDITTAILAPPLLPASVYSDTPPAASTTPSTFGTAPSNRLPSTTTTTTSSLATAGTSSGATSGVPTSTSLSSHLYSIAINNNGALLATIGPDAGSLQIFDVRGTR
jgi:WD40 repeat protein